MIFSICNEIVPKQGAWQVSWTKKNTLGAGYRIHLFEAGAASEAPYGVLPYREGYTELYTTLDRLY